MMMLKLPRVLAVSCSCYGFSDPHDCEICQHYPAVVCGSCGVKGNLHGIVAYVAVTMVTCVGPTQTTIVMFQ